MKITFGLLLILAAIIGCKENQNPISANQDKSVESQIVTRGDSLGKIIATIDFGVKAKGEDLKTFDDGIIPWVSIEKPESENLIDADKMVLQFKSATLLIDYPLNKPAVFEINTNEKG